MNAVKENTYGLTHTGAVSDMSDSPILRDQLLDARIPFDEVELPMSTLTSINASIISYHSPQKGTPVSVLIIPQAGIDSWCEEYFYFVGTTLDEMLTKNWPELIDPLRRVAYPNFYGAQS